MDSYLELYRAVNDGKEDAKVKAIGQLSQAQAAAAYAAGTYPYHDWGEKIKSFLYLIRPDEQPHS